MTNINIEDVLGNTLYKGINVLRGRYAIEQSIPIMLEGLFLNLYSHKVRGFRKKILSEDAYELLKTDKLLKDILSDVFNILNNDDSQVFTDLMKCFNDEEYENLLNCYKQSTIFEIAMEQLYKNSGFYYKTSHNLNKLIARTIKNKKFKSLYDPTIGTGTLAIEAAYGHKDVKIYGQEIYQGSLNVCKMLLILDGRIDDINNIHLGNTITNPSHVKNDTIIKFDCIVCDPPMGLRDWGHSEVQEDKFKRFERGIPPKAFADYAFISHIVESLDKKGMAVIVVSSGVLFREGKEGVIRQSLIKENLVDCVIALPNNMMHNTALPVNLLILNKNKKTKDILFIDVAKNVESSRTLTILPEDIIDKVGETYENSLEEDGFSKLINISEIKSNKFNLSVNRYIIETEEEENVDISIIKEDISQLEKKLRDIQNEIKMYM